VVAPTEKIEENVEMKETSEELKVEVPVPTEET
jgi:hypothetical protein